MMAQFPARDQDEPATKADVALVRADMDVLRAELRLELGQLGDRLTNRMLTVAGLGLAAITALLAVFT